MKTVELKYSKTKIDKAGELLKGKHLVSEDFESSLDMLSNWRSYHAMPPETWGNETRKINIYIQTSTIRRENDL